MPASQASFRILGGVELWLGDAQAAAVPAWREARDIYASLGHAARTAELDELIHRQSATTESRSL